MPQNISEAPKSLASIVRQLGPGWIIAASIIGSGELIVTPKLGAEVGFSMLWFIVLGCVLKVFVQFELGRFAITHGKTTLAALDTVPGPRLVTSWVVWLWLAMYIGTAFQVAGMIGGIAKVVRLAGSPWPESTWTIAITAIVVVPLVTGRYRLVESLSIAFVALFTIFTIGAVLAVQWTPDRMQLADIVQGLQLELPPDFATAFAAFGIIGVGASELIFYPYWCLEKGYGSQIGADDGTSAWTARARSWVRVMRIDIWFSFAIYTGATAAFFLLGAATLHGKGLTVGNDNMVETLSRMYADSFGSWGLQAFLLGSFAVLFSTVFVATASNARLFADALAIFRVRSYASPEDRARWVKIGCALLPSVSLLLYSTLGNPVTLVMLGAFGQALMLPFLGLVAVWFRWKRTPRDLAPGRLWTALLCASATAMIAVGAYQVYAQVRSLYAG